MRNRMFINFSNHVSDNWSKEQLSAANEYGELVDVSFPNVTPDATEDEIVKIGDEYVERIMSFSPDVVMCQGEFTLNHYVVNKLMKNGISCVAACTERISIEEKQLDGTVIKKSEFRFAGFRKYN